MIVDANVLIYAADSTSPRHSAALRWLESALNGPTRIGLPVQSLAAFARITTHPRVMGRPLTADEATGFIAEWLEMPVTWVPAPGATTWSLAEKLMRQHGTVGNLVPDAVLAAMALEHAVPVVSADTDFARFGEVSWINPVAAPSI